MADEQLKAFRDLEKLYCLYRQKVAHLEHVMNSPRHATEILKKYPEYHCTDSESSVGRALIRLAKHQSSKGTI
jgi:hypothetical protein